MGDGVNKLPSGLWYKVLEKGKGQVKHKGLYVYGEGTSRIKPEDSLPMSFKLPRIRGKAEEFDASTEIVAPANVIKGWGEALQQMVEGDKWELYVPPELGFGKFGQPPMILGGSTLILEVELLKIK